jgi:hypothetical protein
MREALLAFLAREYPESLPIVRVQGAEAAATADA